jgi:hypothetical protein
MPVCFYYRAFVLHALPISKTLTREFSHAYYLSEFLYNLIEYNKAKPNEPLPPINAKRPVNHGKRRYKHDLQSGSRIDRNQRRYGSRCRRNSSKAATVSANSGKGDQGAYPKQIAKANERLRTAREVLKLVAPSDEANLAAAKSQVEEAEKTLSGLERAFSSCRKQHRYRFFLDLLSERDGQDRPVIAFHRFQIVVWTLVLGVIFVSDVLTKLTMATFDSSLLVLMGISSRTI